MTLKKTQNTLFATGSGEVDIDSVNALTVHRRKKNAARRELRDVRKLKSAAEAIQGLDHEHEYYGFTRGKFSLIDLILAIQRVTGPCHLTISTWTAAQHELDTIHTLCQRGDLTGTRWLIDFSMARREPAMVAQMRERFDWNNIRVAQIHSKFQMFQNAEWQVVLRGSMNLNMNPRCEDFTLAHDPELAAFLNTILDELFSKQPKTLANAKPYDIVKWCNEHET
ncbi:MAG: hypothetical protein RBS99_16290 [Rhodospirillales bacterium]|jgi:hypothetical protein|nr:hypothetical protein [Rhodospirillales bacterium]